MANLDSIKILAPISSIDNFNSLLYTDKIESDSDNISSQKSVLRHSNTIGLKSVIIDKIKDNVCIEMSAKILLNDYSRGLNINTISDAISNINKGNEITFNSTFLDTAEILRADVTDNIKPSQYSNKFYSSLSTIPIAKKYHIDLYNRKNNLGIVFKGNQKTVRDRMIIYDKCTEIANDKNFGKYVNTNKILNDFKGIARVESNHSQFKQIKKFYDSRNLIDILQSDVKLNYDIFSRITARAESIELSLFNEFEGMKWKDILKYIGYKGIIEMFDYDIQSIELFVAKFSPNNYRRDRKELHQHYMQLQQKNGNDYSIIEDIKNQLKIA
jgi:hypothetical protein